MTAAPRAPAAIIVIFGALGDLTRRLLVPAILNLAAAGLLSPETAIQGVSHHDGDDQTLFQRADQIEAGWRAVQPILDIWRQGTPEDYPAGSAGPKSADALMHRSHRRWHHLG